MNAERSTIPEKHLSDAEAVRRLHGLIEQLAGRFRGYLPWPETLRDATVRGHEAFIADTIAKADAILGESSRA